ncbi:MAG: DUF4143 domain-containing protein [Gemmatimonadetes bacterium]|nr:DUF4143 domain-containing protein [Gemmatimonadota bacterium]
MNGSELPPISRLLPPPHRSAFLFGARGTGKTTYVRQAFPDATVYDLRDGALMRALTAEPELLHGMLDATDPARWVVVDEVGRVPGILDVIHQRMDREPARRFLLTGSSARALHRAGVNLLGGRAGRRLMPTFLAAELGERFTMGRAERLGLLPLVWGAADPAQALADYATVAVHEEARAEARVRRVDDFTRALAQLALAQASVLSISTIAQQAGARRASVDGWISLLEEMFLVARVPMFAARPSRRALAAQPKFYFADAGVALALRPGVGTAASPEALGAAREGVVFQHLAAWCDGTRDAALSTWRTTAGLEVDFVVREGDALTAIEVKSGPGGRPQDRRALLAFGDEFPDARLVLLAQVPVRSRKGPIEVWPLETFLRGVRPGTTLPGAGDTG